MSKIERFLVDIERVAGEGPEISHRRCFPEKEAVWEDFPGEVRPAIREGLASLGISRIYSHQAEAMKRILSGEDIVVVTPTASGKTLCYNVPVLEHIAREPEAKALYLFPMKALGQDQLTSFMELAGACGLDDRAGAAIYDGDTSSHHRGKIRKSPPAVVITNPDMLHAGIVAYHEKWVEFFSNLKIIVIDEVHTYRGVFGSHVANVLRRLLRTAAHYGSRPQVVASSATIANPAEHVSALVDREVQAIEKSGAPEAKRHFAFINPGIRSNSSVAARLLKKAVRDDLSTIVFTKARKITELIYSWAIRGDSMMRDCISAYRAGYLPEERREIENRLFKGKLKGVVSTSALEAGIDIGVLDVCILVGYPGTISRTWQRGGRVGRQERESLIAIIAGEDALDQYFMKHPAVFFETGFEPAVIDPDNVSILKSQLICAAAEFPLDGDDEWFPAKRVKKAIGELEREGGLVRSVADGRWKSAKRYPQREVNIRGIGESYTIFEEKEAQWVRGSVVGIPSRGVSFEEKRSRPAKKQVIGSLDGNRVFAEGHPGAVYLHRAVQYQVTRLDLEKRNLWARAVSAGYYTLPHKEKETHILAVRKSRLVGNFVARLGELKVTEQVVGYEKKRISTGERLSVHGLDLPKYSFETVGFWIEIDEFIARAVKSAGMDFMGGIHALEHAAIALFPLFSLCEPDDIGGISTPLHMQVGKGAVFFYDGYPGGVGLSEKSFASIEGLLEKTYELISSCDCDGGCPACIYSAKCGSGNVPLDKAAAAALLALLLDRPGAMEGLAVLPADGDETVEFLPEEPEMADEEEMAGPEVQFLDIETRRSAAEVGGWKNAHLMGVAVAVSQKGREGEQRAYRDSEIESLFDVMVKADLVVGFNIVGFDYKVLSAYDSGTIAKVPTFDILRDVHRRLGYRLSLAHIAEHTIGETKSADGLQSLQWVKEGRFDLVEEYCRQDVKVTARVFYHGVEKGWIRFIDREGDLLELPVDWDVSSLVEGATR